MLYKKNIGRKNKIYTKSKHIGLLGYFLTSVMMLVITLYDFIFHSTNISMSSIKKYSTPLIVMTAIFFIGLIITVYGSLNINKVNNKTNVKYIISLGVLISTIDLIFIFIYRYNWIA